MRGKSSGRWVRALRRAGAVAALGWALFVTIQVGRGALRANFGYLGIVVCFTLIGSGFTSVPRGRLLARMGWVAFLAVALPSAKRVWFADAPSAGVTVTLALLLALMLTSIAVSSGRLAVGHPGADAKRLPSKPARKAR
jgi:hypothetical protein